MEDKNTSNEVNEQPNTDSAKIPIAPNDPYCENTQPVSNKPEQTQISELRDRVRRAERWMIGFTGAIALFGLCSVGVGILQWCSLKGQLKEMQSSSIDTHELAVQAKASSDSTKTIAERALEQTNATNDLARVAKKQASIAEKALSLAAKADRPWIGPLGVSVDPSIMDGKEYKITMSVINAGRRPARVTKHQAGANLFSVFPKDPPYIVSTGDPKKPSRTIVVPGRSLNSEWPGKPLDPLAIELIKNGLMKFYIYGISEYEDIGTGEGHTTQICYYYLPINNSYVFCPEYNDAN